MNGRPSRRWARVLAISDESQLLKLVRSILRPLHFALTERSFRPAQTLVCEDADIVIIDVERFSGEAVSEVRRRFPSVEVIVLCRDFRDSDAVFALEMGVDFLGRPFRSQELLTKVHAAELRRIAALGYKPYYRLGSLVVDTLGRRVTYGGGTAPTSCAELTVLILLVREPGRLVTFDEILAALGRRSGPERRQGVRVLIGRLRSKLAKDPKQPLSIENDARMGYRLTISVC